MKKFKLGILVLIMSLFVTGCGCSKQTINVSFDTDGGSAIKTQTIEKGSSLEEPSEPTRDGYTFEGWYISEDATEEFDFSTKIEEDITLYAKWSMKVSTEVEKPETDDKDEVELSVSKTSVKLEVGKSTTIKVTTNSDKKVSWKTSDKAIATVKDGKITAVKVGSATITVTVDGESETIKVTVVKKAETTAKTTTKKVETTKPTTKPATTVDPDKTKLNNALASIKAKNIEKAGVSLKYSFDGCTIKMTSSHNNLSIDGVVTKVYRDTSAKTITADYKVTCGKYSDTKTVKHTIPASTYKYTTSVPYEGMVYINISGAKNFTLNKYLKDIDGQVQYPDHKNGFVYDMVFNNDEDTTYAVKPA